MNVLSLLFRDLTNIAPPPPCFSFCPSAAALGMQKLRQQSYKQGTSKEENRSRRTKTTLSIRRQKKMQALKRRRHIPDLTPEEQEQVVSNTGFSVNANTGAHQVEQLPQLMDQLRYGDGQRQLEATTMFRKLLSIEKTPPIDLVIEAGAVPIFIAFLDEHDFPQLQFEAAWALTNIASGKTEHTKIVIENGAVQPLIGLLSSGNDDVREQVSAPRRCDWCFCFWVFFFFFCYSHHITDSPTTHPVSA